MNAMITYDNIRKKEDSTGDIIYSYKVIQSSTQLLALFMDMETSQRGYIVTKDAAFLASYCQADTLVSHEIGTLTTLMHDGEDRAHPEDLFLKAVRVKQEDLESTLAVFSLFGKDSAINVLATRRGKERMDSIRHFVDEIVGAERAILAQQHALLEANRRLDPLRFSGFALITFTSLLALFTIFRKDKRNALLLRKLRQSNRDLESKVEKRTQQLVIANQAKDHFLGIATHDLKSPINGILGLISLIKLQNHVHGITAEYLDHIEESCRKMKRLITELLDINRIDQGLNYINKAPVKLDTLLSGIEMEFRGQAEAKAITLKISKMPVTIYTDQNALSRILENLLSNAIKFSPAYREVRLRVSQEQDLLRFDVEDEGPGLADEEIPVLFQKFQVLGNRPTGNESSHGLGLSIVKELVGLLGGTIWVSSRKGAGTTFTVSLPSSAMSVRKDLQALR